MSKAFLPPFIFLSLITILVYSGLTQVFYQQDEWQNIGNNIILKNFTEIFDNLTPAKLLVAQDRFASILLSYIFFGKLSFNTSAIALYSIFFHTANSLLVFYLVRKWIIKNSLFASIGTLFFTISSVSHSAVSWFGTSLGTLVAVTLILSSLILYFNYLSNLKIKWLYVSLLTLYISLFFKEIGIFLFLLMPLGALLYNRLSWRDFFKKFWPFLFIFFSIAITRLTWFLSVDRSSELFISSSTTNNIPTIITRFFFYPLTSLSLTFIPQELLINFAKFFTNIYYPLFPSEHFNIIVQTVVIDLFAVALTLIILFIFYLAVRKESITIKKHAIFWVAFFVLSFLPYVLLSKSFAYLESRYYYLSNLPSGIILGLTVFSLNKYLNRWRLGMVAIFLVGLFLVVHLKYLNKSLMDLIAVSQERRSLLSQLSRLKPTFDNNKNIFYITGNHDFYLVGNHVPFQQGMGYTLMIWYYQTGKIPSQLIKDKFLWNLNTEGYKEIASLGFGFFSDEHKLRQTIKDYHLTKNQVNALFYDFSSKELKKIDLNL
ncbi:hypothetical protein HY404_00995 [Candidatus Microgenomates bacterium]|nr:hypothetical protein [Candidatus Microgenomates bacterium]